MGMAKVKIDCAFDDMVEPEKLVPSPQNPNTHTEEQIKKLARLIELHGWRHPITVSNRSGFVNCGHARLDAAKLLGMKKVPVDYQDFENEAMEWAAMTSDNIIQELSLLDGQIMADGLVMLDELNLDLEGLTSLDLSQIEDYIDGPLGEPDPKDDEVPDVPEKPKTKMGDLYLLGEHRLLCGDATKKEDVERLMNGEKADMVFTDPPYGVKYDGGSSNEKKRSKLIGDNDAGLYLPTLRLCNEYTNDSTAVYLWFAGMESVAVLQAVLQAGYCIRALLIWNKLKAHYGALGAQYKQRHEPMLYLHKKGKSPQWFGPTNECTVWDIEQAHINEYHPTQKPVELGTRAIGNSSKKGDIVWDGFLGSGSTLIACEKLNRKCYGLEIDPRYCDVIVKRWEDYNGRKAKLCKNN